MSEWNFADRWVIVKRTGIQLGPVQAPPLRRRIRDAWRVLTGKVRLERRELAKVAHRG